MTCTIFEISPFSVFAYMVCGAAENYHEAVSGPKQSGGPAVCSLLVKPKAPGPHKEDLVAGNQSAFTKDV